MPHTYTMQPYDEAATLYDVWEDEAIVAFTGTQEECQAFIDSQ